MPHKKRKVRKKRGSRTHGYGRVGQHRGVGQRGGHGKAGRHKHKWTYIVKYEPEYFGKHGFKPPKRREVNAINVGELDEKVSKLLHEKKAVKGDDGIHIDLKEIGYDKLLGRGQITHPLIIRVASYSRSAAEKVNKAKGKIACACHDQILTRGYGENEQETV
jgi:large subunit ribosomal protein L15